MVQAVIMGNQLRLMLQKPTPQPSILDNWYLIKPVNQRAQNSYIASGTYMFDRWIGIYSAGVSSTNVSLTHDGVKINGEGGIRQFFEADLKGRICTIAVLDGENKLFTVTSPILNTEGPQWQIGKQFGDMWIGLRFREDVEKTWDLTITGIDKTIKAVKIELGNRFTGWPVWDYGEELAKCQRYQLLTTENGSMHIRAASLSANNIFFDLPTPVTMRTTPVLADPAVFAVRRFGSIEAESGFTFSALAHTGCVRIEASKKAHGLTDATLIVGKTILDANL